MGKQREFQLKEEGSRYSVEKKWQETDLYLNATDSTLDMDLTKRAGDDWLRKWYLFLCFTLIPGIGLMWGAFYQLREYDGEYFMWRRQVCQNGTQYADRYYSHFLFG